MLHISLEYIPVTQIILCMIFSMHVATIQCLIYRGQKSQHIIHSLHFWHTCDQGSTSTSNISHRLTEYAGVYIHIRHQSQTDRACKMSDFSVVRTNVPLLSCQRGHCAFFACLTLGYRIKVPRTGWSPMVRVYIWPIDTATAVYF